MTVVSGSYHNLQFHAPSEMKSQLTSERTVTSLGDRGIAGSISLSVRWKVLKLYRIQGLGLPFIINLCNVQPSPPIMDFVHPLTYYYTQYNVCSVHWNPVYLDPHYRQVLGVRVLRSQIFCFASKHSTLSIQCLKGGRRGSSIKKKFVCWMCTCALCGSYPLIDERVMSWLASVRLRGQLQQQEYYVLMPDSV